MKFPRSFLVLFVTLLVLYAEKDACAQWKNVAPRLIGSSGLFGASHFKDGILWFGYSDLWNSTDLGQTWTKVNFSNTHPITAIHFFDRNFGLVGTNGNGLYLTNNGGLSWRQVSFSLSSFRGICFGKSKNEIAVCGDKNMLLISKDGGDSWAITTNIQLDDWGHDIYYDPSKGLVLLASPDSPPATSRIYISADFGITWQQRTGLVDYDTFSITHDSCKGNIYALCENNAYTIDNISKIFVSSDNGTSWADPIPMSASYFSGSIESSISTIYAPTLMNGIYRSTDYGTSWKSIGGPNMHYDSRFLAVVNDNMIFACGDDGSIWKTFNSGGDSIKILSIGSLSIAPKSVFDLDTIQCNDSILHSISIDHAGCNPPIISSWSIIGKDSLSYSAGNLTYDSLLITFHPKTKFDNSALLILSLNNGSQDTIRLGGYNDYKAGLLNISPVSLFDFDTIRCLDSITRCVSFTQLGCFPPSVQSWQIIGPDSASYRAGKITFDSLEIIFISKHAGNNIASLIITQSDGLNDTISLNGFNDSPPFTHSESPQQLFTTDSIFICQSKIEKFILNTGGCLPKIISQNITGKNANDYEKIHQINSPLSNFDSVIISFKPSDSGTRNAAYELILDNGIIISIPLQGYGITPHPLAITTTDQSTDTIGGTIYVPITIEGLDHAENVDIVLHYDKELTYRGSYSASNVQLDLVGEEWIGRSKLHIVQAKPNTILGYARFNVFADSLTKFHATFDSVTVLTAVAPCQYILPASVTSTITPPSGCGVQTISRFLHDSTMPELRIIPNPTSGEISITSSRDLSEVTVTVYDMLGVRQSINTVILRKNSQAKTMLPLVNGVYNVRVTYSTHSEDLQVVVNR